MDSLLNTFLGSISGITDSRIYECIDGLLYGLFRVFMGSWVWMLFFRFFCSFPGHHSLVISISAGVLDFYDFMSFYDLDFDLIRISVISDLDHLIII